MQSTCPTYERPRISSFKVLEGLGFSICKLTAIVHLVKARVYYHDQILTAVAFETPLVSQGCWGAGGRLDIGAFYERWTTALLREIWMIEVA